MRGSFRTTAAVAAALVARPAGAQSGASGIVARGQVVDSAGRPFAGAIVTAAPLGGTGPSRSVTTGPAGTFAIPVASDTTLVSLEIRAIGMRPIVTTVGAHRAPTVFRLSSAFHTLGAVRVEARSRPRPRRLDPRAPEPAATERSVGFGAVAVGDQGDLAAMAAATPGVRAISASDELSAPAFSVLGLPADRNVTTLDGLRLPVATVPRDAAVTTRVTFASYDAASGDYSGAEFALRSAPGGEMPTAGLHVTYDDPALQATTRVGRELYPIGRQVAISGNASGPLAARRGYYNAALQFGHVARPGTTPFALGTTALRELGLASDSVRRLGAILSGFGFPTTDASTRDRSSASGMVRLDLPPAGATTGGVLGFGELQRAGGLLIGPSDLSTRGTSLATAAGGVQVYGSRYLRSAVLLEGRAGVSLRHAQVDPTFGALPDARVLVPSAEGYGGVVSFGGSSVRQSAADARRWETRNSLQWQDRSGRHEFKASLSGAVDDASEVVSPARGGTVVYGSLDELAANRPLYWSGSQDGTRARVRETQVAVGLGDTWMPRRDLQVRFGLRAERNRATPRELPDGEETTPGTALLSASRVTPPVDLTLSPRVGLQWSFGQGTRAVGAFPATPRGTFRIGFGAFHQVTPAASFVPAFRRTPDGQPPGSGACFGRDLPGPSWAALLDGTATAVAGCGEADQTVPLPVYTRYDRHFRPPTSWRGSTAVSRTDGPVRWGVDATAMWNVHDPSYVDENLRRQPVRWIDGGTRPAYFTDAEVSPATGTVSPAAGRERVAAGRTYLRTSDARSVGRQLTMSLGPALPTTAFAWGLFYVGRTVTSRSRGFDATTAGDPRAFESSWPEGDVRHELGASVFSVVRNRFFVSLYARATSGVRYSPIVGGDVNGDGLVNDRALVPNASQLSDAAAQSAMRELLEQGPARVRNCLAPQLGSVARRASCVGPWSMTLTTQVGVNPRSLGLTDRASVTLGVNNLLGGLGQLLVGPSATAWGAGYVPDPVLLNVRGYDPRQGAFQYAVNPRFGRARSQVRGLDPFRITLEVRVALGPAPDAFAIKRVLRTVPVNAVAASTREPTGRAPGTAGTLDSAAVRAVIGDGLFDPAAAVAAAAPALGLGAEQVRALRDVSRQYRESIDTAAAGFAQRTSVLKNPTASPVVTAEYRRLLDAQLGAIQRAGSAMSAILSPAQVRALPRAIAAVLDPSSARALTPPRAPGLSAGIFRSP